MDNQTPSIIDVMTDPNLNARITLEKMLRLEKQHVVELRGPELRDLVASSDLYGLALSGGGIRSATFALGVLQAFAQQRLLRKIDYLSVVSGGGYIGSWLSACIYHERKPKLGLATESDPAGALSAIEERIRPKNFQANNEDVEPREIRFLRAFSSYLTPRLGLLSGDTLALLAGFFRNLVLNLFLFVVATLLIVALLHDLVAYGRLVGLSNIGSAGVPFFVTSIAYIAFCLTLQGLNLQTLPERSRKRCRSLLEFPKTALFSLILPGVLFVSIWMTLQDPHIDFVDLGRLTGRTALIILYGVFFAYGVAYAPSLLKPSEHFLRACKSKGTLVGRSVFATIVFSFCVYALLSIHHYYIHPRIEGAWAAAYAVAFGPAVVAMGYWSLYLVWIMVLGSSLSEYAREWLSRIFGQLSCVVFLWVSTGVICIYGRPLWCWLCLLWKTFSWQSFELETIAITVALAIVLVLVTGASRRVISTGNLSVIVERRRREVGKFASFLVMVVIIVALVPIYQSLLVLLLPAGEIPAFREGNSFGELVDRHLSDLASGHFNWETVLFSSNWHVPPAFVLLLALAGLFAVGFLCIDVNVFSLQNLYRNRLVRCYLGAANPLRAPEPYAGFDPNDDLELGKFAEQRPYLLCNGTLNISRGQALGWQQRKAASFLFSPRWCGYWLVATEFNVTPEPGASRGGYVQTNRYVRESASFRDRSDGIMVGTAMATSGAAVSSQMGFASREPRAFLFTLFNMRLGRWLPNPRYSSEKLLSRQSPRLALLCYLSELLGMTTEQSKWIYVSDGGHFENLGIYELVRRRCRRIICVDAGADPQRTFGDLGNAIQKCRVDFGVEITIDTQSLLIDANGLSDATVSVGSISYPEEPGSPAFKGDLIYLKPSIPKSLDQLPADILSYRARHPEFPHEPTRNQWFSETQFESYRKLGYIIGLEALQSVRS
ncbi:patatin-like phospholipase family protein [Methylocystis sp.]|uniref:patatin-like phospholipase family protein n=1 Tax=Methylocystis sp. TaxID=1911079 RepID=UPI0025D400F6|nr:patatin-like phospholipase family protein [Methylocystis sp.]